MKKHALGDIESFVSGLFEEAPFCDRTIEVEAEGADVFITVSQMYEYVDCSFSTLKRLSEFFETENIGDADRWHSHGCETCALRGDEPVIWSGDKGREYYCLWRIPKEWPISEATRRHNKTFGAGLTVGMKDGKDCPIWSARGEAQ